MTRCHLAWAMDRLRLPWARTSRLARLASLLVAIICAAAVARPSVAADQDTAVAAVMGRLLQFVTWPETAFTSRKAPLVVGILDGKEQADILHRVVMGRSNAGHPIEIRLVRGSKDVQGCHLVYIDPDARGEVGAIVAAIAGTATITVSDMPGFLGEGGNVALVVEAKHAAFDVNLTTIEQSGVRVSSRLLQVARAVLRAGM